MQIQEASGRIEELDGIKFILIVLVTIGHFSEPFRYNTSFIGMFYTVLYMFHMPLFIMLSGFFSKNVSNFKIKKRIKNLIEPYTVMALCALIFLSGSWKFMIIPATSYWYLLSLIEWNILLLILNRFVTNTNIKLFISFVGAIFVFIILNQHEEFLSLLKTASFFPFFVMGSILNDKTLNSIRNKNIYLIIITLIVLVLTCLISSRYMHELEWHRKGLFHLSSEYDRSPYHVLFDSLLVYVSSFILSFSLLLIKHLPAFICKYGKHTLLFYVLQDISWNISILICHMCHNIYGVQLQFSLGLL